MLEDGGFLSVCLATEMGVLEVDGNIVLLLGFLACLTIFLSKVLKLGLFLVTTFFLMWGFE